MAEESRVHPRAIGQARALRRKATPAERALWRALSSHGEIKFRRQAPIGPYIADFACMAAKLVIEIDGGAHNAPDVSLRDAKREEWFRTQRFEVVRLKNADVLREAKQIAAHLHTKASALIPTERRKSTDSPPPRGAGPGAGGKVDRLDSSTEDKTSSGGIRPNSGSPHPYPAPRGGGTRQSGSRQIVIDPTLEAGPIKQKNLILMGYIAGAFGVRGEVRVRPYTAEADGIVAYGALLDEHGAVVLTPKRAHAIKDGVAITAKEITTREQAEEMKGTKLYVPRDRLPPPEEDDEFYIVDLIGCAVENLNGDPLGNVAAVHDFGAGDVLEIKSGSKSWFLPFTAENAPQIDLKSRRIIADPPAALLDPTAPDKEED
jgi:16S rRNA processing protein RimM